MGFGVEGAVEAVEEVGVDEVFEVVVDHAGGDVEEASDEEGVLGGEGVGEEGEEKGLAETDGDLEVEVDIL